MSNSSPQDKLEQAKDRQKIFNEFLAITSKPGVTPDQPVLLYKGVQTSPYQDQINHYPSRLKNPWNSEGSISISYPKIGEMPPISEKGLDFLHSDIKEACLCLGQFTEGRVQVKWLGKNALNKNQFWSGTKILPLLNVVCQANTKSPDVQIKNCLIRDPAKREKNVSFFDVASDIISYQNRIASSNSLAAMCKRFETWEGLENWVKKITGNHNLIFQGRYGENPFINQPELFDTQKKQVLLKAAPETTRADNLVTAYDLVRLITMLGWHHHIPQNARLPGAQWHSLETIVRAMGNDPCRYTDVAIQALGLENSISNPVIISKLGNGFSDTRKCTEIVYVAMVQFVDERQSRQNQPGTLRTFGMALRGAKPLQEKSASAVQSAINQDAMELDARMAAEVTEILRRVVTDELI